MGPGGSGRLFGVGVGANLRGSELLRAIGLDGAHHCGRRPNRGQQTQLSPGLGATRRHHCLRPTAQREGGSGARSGETGHWTAGRNRVGPRWSGRYQRQATQRAVAPQMPHHATVPSGQGWARPVLRHGRQPLSPGFLRQPVLGHRPRQPDRRAGRRGHLAAFLTPSTSEQPRARSPR